jgi:hypothetical protein
MTIRPNPAYQSLPVILVHLVASPDSNIAWCSDREYYGDDGMSYIGVPRAICPACAKAPVEYGNPQ